MVANRQLPYEATLEANFKSFATISDNAQYKVILANR